MLERNDSHRYRKKVLFCIGSLRGGGAEKILIDTVSLLDKSKYDITIHSIFNMGPWVSAAQALEDCNYTYSFSFKFSPLIDKILRKVLFIIMSFVTPRILRRLLIKRTYDVEIAFLEGLSTKVVAGSSAAKKYAWVHIDMKAFPYSTKIFRNLKNEEAAYGEYDEILCVSTKSRLSFIEKYPINPALVNVQLNVLDDNKILEMANDATVAVNDKRTGIHLVSVGRLSHQKGYIRLLSVVKRLIYEDKIDLSLTIIGDGEDKDKLTSLIDKYGLNNYVSLPGFLSNPYPVIKNSDIFVCSSYTEGFSTAVSEATILGVPTVSTDCSGARDILGDSEYGIVVDNSEYGIYAGLKNMISKNEILSAYKLKSAARRDFFRVENRVAEFEYLLDER